jgi:hypothetical protein
MTKQELWLLAQTQAAEIVASVKAEYPDSEDVLNFDFGGSDSRSSTAFSRRGTSETARTYDLPSDLAALIRQGFQTSSPQPALSDSQAQLLTALLTRDNTLVPGRSALDSIINLDPTGYTGEGALRTMSARNPYSNDYENAIGSLYDRQFATARSLAQSGPLNVRGGTARQGFELGELGAQNAFNKFREVRGQQDREAGVVQGAVQLLNTIEGLRRGSVMQGQQQRMAGESARTGEGIQSSSQLAALRQNNLGHLQLAGDMLGSPKNLTTDNLAGRGNQVQNTSNWGVGLSCCFIFLEALNGKLPWYVYLGQKQHVTPYRRAGYKWMSRWLVPLMQRIPVVKKAVNLLMVRPFLIHGKGLYTTGQKHPICGIVCSVWLKLWSLIGKLTYGKYT